MKDFGTRERHSTDVLNVYELNKNTLDIKYLKSWAEELGVDSLLDEVVSKSKELE